MSHLFLFAFGGILFWMFGCQNGCPIVVLFTSVGSVENSITITAKLRDSKVIEFPDTTASTSKFEIWKRDTDTSVASRIG